MWYPMPSIPALKRQKQEDGILEARLYSETLAQKFKQNDEEWPRPNCGGSITSYLSSVSLSFLIHKVQLIHNMDKFSKHYAK